MPFTVTMPKLSPTMEVGTIAKWYKKEGEQVESNELLLEVATDKATIEHNVLDGGWLRKILIEEGGEASVNQPIAVFTEEKDESIEGYEPEGIVVEELEEIEEEIEERRERKKIKRKGAKRQREKREDREEIKHRDAETQREKRKIVQPSFAPEPPLEEYAFEIPTEAVEKRVKASPLARKLAKEQGLDISTVKGTGPSGRVMSSDLERAQKSGTVVFGKREVPTLPPGTYEEEALTPMRKVISQRLQESKAFIPHFYVSQAVNVQSLLDIREQLGNMDIKVTLNDCLIRACALALREHPTVNSGFNAENQSIIRFKTIDISVAVGVDEGLITPIIRHADYKNLGEVSVEIRNLVKKAREGKLEMHEYKGGSFTLSNLGMYGVTEFSAIINPPQGAILAVSGIQDVPILKEGKVVPGKVMNVTLSSDHRVIDGVMAAEFVNTLKQFLENPALLLV
ncbi:MAG: Dihydrolipoyllysine-residue acetyltransferase component of pyruvate dehydrogenase complex [Chlamydiae bacterium]|nr:Dihydrolipoyllysine-residue acetyltransferase component of pyruvate dehydrogenase complex [Chlamydiota bacterium]